MDFHLATPTGDVYLFSYDGRQVQIAQAPAAPHAPPAPAPSLADPKPA